MYGFLMPTTNCTTAKIRYYRDVATAMRRTREEDKEEGGAEMRSAMWMGDHNMVVNPALDEMRGSQEMRGSRR